MTSFKQIYQKFLEEKDSFNPDKPIITSEEFNQALWYICDQFQEIANLLRSNISEKLTEASFNFISDGLKRHSTITKEIRKCQENIVRTILSARNYLKNNNVAMSPDFPIFNYINNWTNSIIKFVSDYNKYNKNSNLLPTVIDDCIAYAKSIDVFNMLIDDSNNIENAQHINHVKNLPNNLLE
jgi:hypothetical protein